MDSQLTAFLAKLTRQVARRGYQSIHTHDRAGTDADLPITYSVGFRQRAHPDILIPGLLAPVAASFMAQLHEAIVAGATYAPGELYDSIAAGYLAQFKPIHESWQNALTAVAASVYQRQNGDRTFTAIQLIYPDAGGRWPWDPACEEHIRQKQPRLDLPPQPPRYPGDVTLRAVIGGGSPSPSTTEHHAE
ncbi:MAG: DUF4262 domain-containing protein [Chloroflexales bacterium]